MSLTTQDLQRLTVVVHVEGGQLTASQAAELIGRSERQVRRWLVRVRPAVVRAVMGTIRVARPDYHRAACHQGMVPVDAARGVVAGSHSAGLDEFLAPLGAQDNPSAQAAALEKLTLVHVCPNLVRAATERLGQELVTTEAATVAVAWAGEPPSAPAGSAAPRYVSLDGVLVSTDAGWKECKLGDRLRDRQSPPVPRQPADVVPRAQVADFVVAADGSEPFGPHARHTRDVRSVIEVAAFDHPREEVPDAGAAG